MAGVHQNRTTFNGHPDTNIDHSLPLSCETRAAFCQKFSATPRRLRPQKHTYFFDQSDGAGWKHFKEILALFSLGKKGIQVERLIESAGFAHSGSLDFRTIDELMQL